MFLAGAACLEVDALCDHFFAWKPIDRRDAVACEDQEVVPLLRLVLGVHSKRRRAVLVLIVFNHVRDDCSAVRKTRCEIRNYLHTLPDVRRGFQCWNLDPTEHASRERDLHHPILTVEFACEVRTLGDVFFRWLVEVFDAEHDLVQGVERPGVITRQHW